MFNLFKDKVSESFGGTIEEEVSNFESLKISQPTGIVLGAEGYGLRRLVRQSCDQLVKIQGNGELKNLNISNAAAVALYEIKKGIPNLSNE